MYAFIYDICDMKNVYTCDSNVGMLQRVRAAFKILASAFLFQTFLHFGSYIVFCNKQEISEFLHIALEFA